MKMEFDIEKMDDDTKRRFLICAIDGRRLREFTRDFSVINSRLKDLGEYDRDYRKEHKEELSASHDRIAQDALSEFDKTGEESTKRLYGADWEKYIEMEKKLLEMYDRGRDTTSRVKSTVRKGLSRDSESGEVCGMKWLDDMKEAGAAFKTWGRMLTIIGAVMAVSLVVIAIELLVICVRL